MKSNSHPLPTRIGILATGYAGFFLITLWAAYTNQLPTGFLNQIPYYDKIGHVVLYCIAGYLGHRLLQRRHYLLFAVHWPIFPSLFALFTLAEEITQGFSPYRTLDAGDLLCSAIGIVLGYGLAQRPPRQP
jgi:VanZ family protein